MKLKSKLAMGVAIIVEALSFAQNNSKVHASSYSINNTYALSGGEGSPYKTNSNMVIAHATGVYAPVVNNASFEKRTWYSNGAYVQYIVGDGGKVYSVGAEGYQSWGAGTYANENSPVQVELAQTYDQTEFNKDYVTYVNLPRDRAKAWGIPTTVDDSTYRGIKSHLWVTNNIWGDHTDPYGYLATHGISKAQFAHDIANGFSSSGNNTNAIPKPSKPTVQKGRMVKEDATFKNGDEPIQVRYGSTLSSRKAGMLTAGASIHYYGYVVDSGYVWIVYTSNSNDKLYCPVRPVGKTAWGTFK
ncbi:N-acetylmuramoyl-L-alanine amidase [Pediococcus claussenii]|uniref:N-acetylmuramoyl-L-alanine amidase n=1 Tax=Pediococcus claussenii TaxID=187452 RepID=UPI001E5E602A|nr:N-acetylmuramoyl-L-alanine amidase [Pediococcus claussenii]